MNSPHPDQIMAIKRVGTFTPDSDFYVDELVRFSAIRTASPQMVEAIETASLFARSDISILLHGESGTGKELFAQYIHEQSRRNGKRLITVNAAALPETLAESLLFGHEKGAFSGASAVKEGLIEAADGGTLFLDEVGDLPPAIQTKLLRVVQSHSVLRVGATVERQIDVRFIFASHRNISDMVENGSFREDLYYRIQETLVEIPPLRDRGDDAILLAKSFAIRFGREAGVDHVEITEEALSLIAGHSWPGNVRELQSAIRRAVIVAKGGSVDARHLQIAIPRSSSTVFNRGLSQFAPMAATAAPTNPQGDTQPANLNFPTTLASMVEMRKQDDMKRVISALEKVNGNVSKAAEMLGVSRPTIYNILRRAQPNQVAAG